MNNLYLTKKEIEDIENLDIVSLPEYIKNFDLEKRELIVKQFDKELQLKMFKTILNEKY